MALSHRSSLEGSTAVGMSNRLGSPHSVARSRTPDSMGWRSEQTDALALAVLRANMSNCFADGSATCAFLFPSTIDGVAAHAADPLANDQDWHLVIWLDLLSVPGVPVA